VRKARLATGKQSTNKGNKMKNKVTELGLNCTRSKYSRFDLWACKDEVELYMVGLIHMQEESLQCVLSKKDALKLAAAIYEHFGLSNKNS